MFKTMIVMTALTAALAQAKTMSCMVGVYRASDALSEDVINDENTKVVDVQLDKNGEGEAALEINGEKVEVSLGKRQYADVYDFMAVLVDPQTQKLSAVITDFLINEGPARDDGWTIKPGPGAMGYEYMKMQSGAFAITEKTQKALVAANMWGKHPFTSTQISVQDSGFLYEVMPQLLSQKLLTETDVIGLSTMFNCTLNK